MRIFLFGANAVMNHQVIMNLVTSENQKSLQKPILASSTESVSEVTTFQECWRHIWLIVII